jgi:hypothetical protein
MLDSAEGDPERNRDLSVGKPVSDQPEHLRFAPTQPAESTIGFQWVAPSQVLDETNPRAVQNLAPSRWGFRPSRVSFDVKPGGSFASRIE